MSSCYQHAIIMVIITSSCHHHVNSHQKTSIYAWKTDNLGITSQIYPTKRSNSAWKTDHHRKSNSDLPQKTSISAWITQHHRNSNYLVAVSIQALPVLISRLRQRWIRQFLPVLISLVIQRWIRFYHYSLASSYRPGSGFTSTDLNHVILIVVIMSSLRHHCVIILSACQHHGHHHIIMSSPCHPFPENKHFCMENGHSSEFQVRFTPTKRAFLHGIRSIIGSPSQIYAQIASISTWKTEHHRSKYLVAMLIRVLPVLISLLILGPDRVFPEQIRIMSSSSSSSCHHYVIMLSA
eukprot:1543688-Amphidinium_carterae.3